MKQREERNPIDKRRKGRRIFTCREIGIGMGEGGSKMDKGISKKKEK